LEDKLWAEFKRLGIHAEREEFVQIGENNSALDFAIYCATGSIDVETDGDSWHATPEKAAEDNRRNNDLESAGWNGLRFTTHPIQEEMAEYTIPKVMETINNLGGVDEGGLLPRKIDLDESGHLRQLGLFDKLSQP
jgi:very-short-patch-repair endonuclease